MSCCKNKSRYKTTRGFLIFWTLFIGIGAVAGAIGMLVDPSGKAMGMDAMLPYFQVFPFADILFCDLTFSGIALLTVNGVTNITAAIFLLLNKKTGIVLGGIFGITLMLWICIQFYMFPLNFMSTAYFIFGAIQAATGYMALIFYKQENFAVKLSDYTNIGTDKTKLVVYFSRMGYVKKIACEEANKTGADIYEIKAATHTDSTTGFWWCGRFGLHRWCMPIQPLDIDVSTYEHVTVCTPIWVFATAAPIREFCHTVAGKIKEADYISVHHTNGMYKNVPKELDDILGICHTAYSSVRCRTGAMKTIS